MDYPTAVAREIEMRRPDLTSDAIRTVLTADDTLTADQAIEILDTATYDAAFERAYEIVSQRYGVRDDEDRKAVSDALNNVWVESVTVDEWAAAAARMLGCF